MLNISQKDQGNVTILSVYGRVDHATSPEFEKSIFSVINNGGQNVVIDFANFNYISSSGLRVLLLALKTMKANSGNLVLATIPQHIYEVIETSGFHTLFQICDSVEDGVNSIGGDKVKTG